MAAAQLIAETQANVPVAEAPAPAQSQTIAESTPMEVDFAVGAEAGSKRKAEDDDVPERQGLAGGPDAIVNSSLHRLIAFHEQGSR